jgi:hypothetical protein
MTCSIVDSGDALTLGIGAMTDARMASFFDKMVRAGVVKPTARFWHNPELASGTSHNRSPR